jgi:hypothetical protein
MACNLAAFKPRLFIHRSTGTTSDDIAYIYCTNGTSTRIPNIRNAQWYSQHHKMHTSRSKNAILWSQGSTGRIPATDRAQKSKRPTPQLDYLRIMDSMVLGLLGNSSMLGLWTNIAEHSDPRIAKVTPLASEVTI